MSALCNLLLLNFFKTEEFVLFFPHAECLKCPEKFKWKQLSVEKVILARFILCENIFTGILFFGSRGIINGRKKM